MKDYKRLKAYFKIILGYEFKLNYYGKQQSEYTRDIIEIESRRLAKGKDFDNCKVYIITKNSRNWRMRKFDAYKNAFEFSKRLMGDYYLIYNNKVFIPIVINNEVVDQNIGEI